MSEIELTSEQQEGLSLIWNWYINNTKPYFVLSGYSGTGKTTLICEFIKKTKHSMTNIALAAYTGKASSVLYDKLKNIFQDELKFYSSFIGTIHSMMYYPEERTDENGKIYISWKKRKHLDYSLLIIDEASMISDIIKKDLLSYNIPILFVGDNFQLPPINGKGILIDNIDYQLHQIVRQALDNPIIKLSMDIRNGINIKNGIYSNSVLKLDWYNPSTQNLFSKTIVNDDFSDSVVICGMNKTRVFLNSKIRKLKNYKDDIIYSGEKFICLKNNYDIGIFNGQIFSLLFQLYYNKRYIEADLKLDGTDEIFSIFIDSVTINEVNHSIINDTLKLKEYPNYLSSIPRKLKYKYKYFSYVDYGYCISCHKAQASEWNKVIVFEENCKYWDEIYYRKWLYTAITRARNKLLWIKI